MFPYKAIIEKSIGTRCPHITLEKEIKRRKGVNVHKTTFEKKTITIDLSR